MLLEGKNAIITGARRGIGAATVSAFAREGANVWACARTQDDSFEESMAAIADKHGVWVKPVYFDLSDSDAMKQAVKGIRAEKKPVDVLVNNAGVVSEPTAFAMTPMSRFREVFEVNYFAQVEFTQLVLRVMMRQQSGAVVNVASIAGIESAPGQAEYGASKAALALTTKKLAAEYGLRGIRVNAVAPGIVDTDMGNLVVDEVAQRVFASSALSRPGTPAEIANVIAFLASDASSYVTGQVVRVDGGVGLAADRLARS